MLLWDANSSTQTVSTWRSIPDISSRISNGSLIVSLVTGGLLLVCLVLELALRWGWEPKWMRRLIPGVIVERKFYNKTDLGFDRKFILVRMPNGQQEEFECDAGEHAGVTEGDCIHLYVIGPYVESYRVVPEARVDDIRKRAQQWGKDIEVAPFLRAYGTYPMLLRTWLVTFLLLVVCGYFLCMGAAFALTGEIYLKSRRGRYSSVYDEYFLKEEWIHPFGVGIIFVVLLGWFVWVRAVQRGVYAEQSGDGDDWWNYRTQFPYT